MDASETEYLDHDVPEIVREIQETQAPERTIRVDLVGFDESDEIANTLEKEVPNIGIKSNGTAIPVFEPGRKHDELLGDEEAVKV